MTPILVAHCRSGFEAEAAIDLGRIAAQAGTAVEIDAPLGRALVTARPSHFDAERLTPALQNSNPVFVRSLLVGDGPHALFEAALAPSRVDRIAPLVALIERLRAELPFNGPDASRMFGELRLETPDTNEGKKLSPLCRALSARLADRLIEHGLLMPRGGPTLHVVFLDGKHVHVGASMPPWSSPWPMGIPRLHMPRAAPSRSTLKLAEAFVTFLGEREHTLMRAGMHAVDLGAAPGGWTWQLVQRGLRVVAVDNGPLKGDIAHDPLVTHLRVDGFTYRPRRRVDWMVCDMVEQPARIAELVARWIGEGYARHCIFNLKLPMKRRYDEVVRCRALIADALHKSRARHAVSLRQLYHDRAEVTGFVTT